MVKADWPGLCLWTSDTLPRYASCKVRRLAAQVRQRQARQRSESPQPSRAESPQPSHNVDAQSLPSIARDLARLQLSGVAAAVLLVVAEAVGDLLRPRLLRLAMRATPQP